MFLSVKEIKENIIFILLAFSLLASSIVFIPFKMPIYSAGLLYIALFSIINKKKSDSGNIFILFYIACILSSIINTVFDYRLFLFGIVIIFLTPVTFSYRIMKFREKYIYYTLMCFPIISIASLYCYYAGINMMAREEGDVSWDFSAFFPHSMWLAAAIGLANTTLIWLVIKSQTIKNKILYIIILLSSIYISVIAASRSALVASLISIIFLLYISGKENKKLLKYMIISCAFLFISYPYYEKSSLRMQAKIEKGRESGNTYGSREALFTEGFKYFKKAPVFGTGFATKYVNGKKIVGRFESGSGWLSILFQTGIFGFSIILVILFRLKRTFKYIKTDDNLQLFSGAFLFLCLHSLFEGYILTSGYYLCIIFWALLGYLYSVPYYYKLKN